jgi:hypothetical protein
LCFVGVSFIFNNNFLCFFKKNKTMRDSIEK